MYLGQQRRPINWVSGGIYEGESCQWLTAYVRPVIVAVAVERRLVREKVMRRKWKRAGRKRQDTLCINACWLLLLALVEERTRSCRVCRLRVELVVGFGNGR